MEALIEFIGSALFTPSKYYLHLDVNNGIKVINK